MTQKKDGTMQSAATQDLASHPEEIKELPGEYQQADAGGNLGPQQMLSVEHGNSLSPSCPGKSAKRVFAHASCQTRQFQNH